MASYTKIVIVSCCLSSLVLTLVSSQELRTPRPTLSPENAFIASPRNKTVLEGDSAVLRCKIKDTVFNCQWYYLEHGLDMLDQRNSPTLVMSFSPTKHNDCSIQFSKARLIQSGQWICKGLHLNTRKYVVSHPATLTVLAKQGNATDDDSSAQPNDGKEDDKSIDITFHLSDEGHLINTKLGDTAILGCQTNHQLDDCSWIRPDGTTLHINNKENYALEGNYTVGNCSLRIIKVREEDEGNWRCVVSTNLQGDKLGPLIHLHIFEFGANHEGFSSHHRGKAHDSSLIIVLVTTSIILLIIIIALVFYMYKRVWKRRNSPNHKYLDTNKSTSDYSNYGSSWLPEVGKGEKLMDDGTEMHTHYDKNQAQNSRYLDMTGNKKGEGYIMFPASVRSSMSSRTTISTTPAGHNAIAGTEQSTRTSASDSLHSTSTFGNVATDVSGIQSRELPRRSESICSDGHLYEEIDEIKRKRGDKSHEDYSNIEEDPEGYMIPKSCSPDESITMEGDSPTISLNNNNNTNNNNNNSPRAPPYSKISEQGLIPDSEEASSISNPTYSDDRTVETEVESYDAPSDPPVPLRIDSKDNPLAEYDVPKKSSDKTDPVFI